MADRVIIHDKELAAGLTHLSRKVKRPIYPRVVSSMMRRGMAVARKEYRRVIPYRTGLTKTPGRVGGLATYVRRNRGYPYIGVMGAITTGGRPGIRIHWTDEGTRERYHKTGKYVGRIRPANYVRPMILSVAPRVLQTMKAYLRKETERLLRLTASEMQVAGKSAGR